MSDQSRLYISFRKTSTLEWVSSYAGWDKEESYDTLAWKQQTLNWSRNIAEATKTALEKQGIKVLITNINGRIADYIVSIVFDDDADAAEFMMRAMGEGISISYAEYIDYYNYSDTPFTYPVSR